MNLNWIDIACYSSETIGMVLTFLTIKSLDKPLKLFGVQIILGFLLDVCWGLPTSYFGISNGWLYNIYLFAEFIIINSAVVFWINDWKIKTTIKVAVILYLLMTLFHLWQNPNLLNNAFMIGSYLFNSIIFLFLIFEKFKTNELTETSDPIVWILFLKILFFMMQVPSLTLPRGVCNNGYSYGIIINNINGIANLIHYAGTGICFLIIHRKKQRQLKKQLHV